MKKLNSLIVILRNNIFSLICLLLFLLVIATGSISYGKYIISDSRIDSSNVGSFSVSANMDNISGFSFTNTSFWSTSDNNKIAMNALRTLNFSVNNFKNDNNGNQKISNVKLKYNLSFSAPANFIEKLAIQIFNDEGNPILPQIVIGDLINANNTTYDTSKSLDYNGTAFNELIFNVNKNNNFLTATSDSTIITIEEYEQNVSQTLLFRMWDVSALTNENNKELDIEGGKVLSPLEVKISQTVKFYRVSIIMDSFILPVNNATTNNYSIKLVPTEIISDDHLRGVIVDAEKDNSGTIVNTKKIKELYSDSNKEWYIKSNEKDNSSSYTSIKIDKITWTKLNSNNETETITYDENNKLYFFDNDIQKIYLSECYSKSFPFFVNVIFEQAQ